MEEESPLGGPKIGLGSDLKRADRISCEWVLVGGTQGSPMDPTFRLDSNLPRLVGISGCTCFAVF